MARLGKREREHKRTIMAANAANPCLSETRISSSWGKCNTVGLGGNAGLRGQGATIGGHRTRNIGGTMRHKAVRPCAVAAAKSDRLPVWGATSKRFALDGQ
jgi:hypothetical protein